MNSYSTTLNAQKLLDLEITVVNVSHDYECCDDGVGSCLLEALYNRPEPRWNFRESYDDGTGLGPGFSGQYLFNPGDGVDCGTLNVAQDLGNYNSVCAERAIIEIESWEDDSGADDMYDDGTIIGINPDDNYSGTETFYIDFLNDTENVATNHTLNLSNGYTATVSVKWNSNEPTVTSGITACFGLPTSIDVTSSLSVGATDFALFTDAGLTNQIATGNPLITPAYSAPATYYVAQINGSCLSDATQVDITLSPPGNPTCPCTAPDNIQHMLEASAKCNITWDPYPNALKYDVIYRPVGTTQWTRTGALNNYKTLRNLLPNTLYVYRVRSYCGTWDFANASEFRYFNTANMPVSFSGKEGFVESTTEIINLYPNPARNVINLEFSTANRSDVNLYITNMVGKNVYETTIQDVEGFQRELIDISNLDQGYYIVTMISEDQKLIKKFVKL